MNARIATLTLVTLSTLAAACDTEPAPSSDAWQLRDGEVFIPPTTTTGGGLVVKGGHDNPEDILMMPFDTVPPDYQLEFHAEALEQALKVIEDEFLANERNLAQCPWICEEASLSWNEGVYVADLAVEYSEVLTETDREGTMYWTTDADYSASVGCGCE